MIHEAVRTTLISATDVSDVIGTKVFPAIAPQGTELPYITYQIISNNADQHMSGASGLQETRIQLNCWSASYAEVQNLAEAVRESLLPMSGTINSTLICGVTSEGKRDTYEKPQSGEEVGVYGVSEDFNIWFK